MHGTQSDRKKLRTTKLPFRRERSKNEPSSRVPVASGAGLSVDVVLENNTDPDEIDAQLVDIRRGVARTMLSHARRKDIPLVHAAALWVLAMRGRGSVFGEEERTAAYTDYD